MNINNDILDYLYDIVNDNIIDAKAAYETYRLFKGQMTFEDFNKTLFEKNKLQ
jgi:hypothetical protein